MGRVAGKVIVVTGAARGQGRAAAELLAREGATVWCTDIADTEIAPLDGVAGTLTPSRLDVTRERDWHDLAARITERDGRVDGLVNNAGIASRGRLPNVDLDEWRRAFDVNATGPLLGMQVLYPLFGSGASIVNVVSVAGLSGHSAAAYTASKWALRGLTRTASLEYGMHGIRVNAIFPGLIDTPLMADASAAFRDAAIAETPLGRIGTVADIAPLIVFLLSDESSYLNGAEITVDGGLTAHVSHKSISDATRS
ncbi:MAG: SDR family oxidoreductase [Pseudolysinimonas sp.]